MKQKFRFTGKLLPFRKQENLQSHISPKWDFKNYKYIIGLLILWALVMLFGVMRCNAQIKPLKVGDSIPDIAFSNILNYKSNTLKLSDFKDKIVVLDFWATWCSGCLIKFPDEEALQKQLRDTMQIILVNSKSTRNKHADVVKFFDSRNRFYDFPSIDEDTILCKLFPGAELPNLVWIKNNKVIALPEPDDLTLTKIRLLYKNQSVKLTSGQKEFHDFSKSILPGPLGNDAVCYSYLGRYNDGFYPSSDLRIDNTQKVFRIGMVNFPLENLIESCCPISEFTIRRVIKHVRYNEAFSLDSTSLSWRQKYCFSYESSFSPRPIGAAWSLMREDMERYFSLRIDTVMVDTTCFVISLGDTSKLKPIKKTKGSYSESNVSERLNMPGFFHAYTLESICNVLEEYGNGFYVNETHLSGHFNLDVPEDLDNYKKMSASFAKQGFLLRRQKRKITFLRITSLPESTNHSFTINSR